MIDIGAVRATATLHSEAFSTYRSDGPRLTGSSVRRTLDVAFRCGCHLTYVYGPAARATTEYRINLRRTDVDPVPHHCCNTHLNYVLRGWHND